MPGTPSRRGPGGPAWHMLVSTAQISVPHLAAFPGDLLPTVPAQLREARELVRAPWLLET